MKFTSPILITASIFFSQASFASNTEHEEGEKLFNTHCAACHGASAGGMDLTKRIAPPIASVRLHYIGPYPDEASFVEAVTGWVEKQDESKTLMPGAIRKFKLMPQLTIPKEDSKKIAKYIYAGEIEKPEGFEAHVIEEHGSLDFGKGMYGEGKGQHNLNSGKQGKGQKGMHYQGNGMKGHSGQGQGQGQGQGKHGMNKGFGEGKNHKKNMLAQKGYKHGKNHSMGSKMFKGLDLTEDQQQKIQSLMQEKHERLDPVNRELIEIERTMFKIDTQSADYKSQVFSLADEKAKRVHRKMIEKGEMRMKIESILTESQRAKFREGKLKFKNKMYE